MLKLNYKAGSIIKYRPFTGPVRKVVVEDREEDVKNGRPGFVGTTTSGEDVWGYDDQIIEVVKR
jgi:hypothetical protein